MDEGKFSSDVNEYMWWDKVLHEEQLDYEIQSST